MDIMNELSSGEFGSTGRSAARILHNTVETRNQYKELFEQKVTELAERQQKLKEAIRQLDMLRWIVETAKVGDFVFAVSNTRIKDATISGISYTPETKLIVDVVFDCDSCCGGCPFESTWDDYVSGEGGCDNEWGCTQVSVSEFGVSLFNDRKLAEHALAEKVGNPRLEDTLISIYKQDGKKMLRYFGYAYNAACSDNEENSFRWVEYCGLEVDLEEVIRSGAKNYENQNGSEVKQYITDMNCGDVDTLLSREIHPIVISENLTEDIPCGIYWLR